MLGLAGFLGLENQYENEVVPTLEKATSSNAFELIDETARDILTNQRTFWMTGGLVVAVWQLSGAVRTAGNALNHVYHVDEERTWWRRGLQSLWIATAVIVCLVAALAAATIPPLLYDDPHALLGALLWLARYALAAAFLIVAVGLVVRYMPAERQPTRWVTYGAVLVTAGWLLASAGFGAYVTSLASYGSIYGVFASVVVLMGWTYLSSLAFVAGIAVDAEARERQER